MDKEKDGGVENAYQMQASAPLMSCNTDSEYDR